MSVSALLAESRQWHRKYRLQAHDRKKFQDYPTLEGYVREALRTRQEAHNTDPSHADPAWLVDKIDMRGQSETYSDKLLAFYQHYISIP